MSSVAVVPRVLGALFYYSPETENAKWALEALPSLPQEFSWQSVEEIESLVKALPEVDSSVLTDFSVLFEGQGKMPAPPWGSVYLNADNTVMGESTVLYRQFLSSLALALDSKLNEPEDQFGLMLLALAALLEQEKDNAAILLLETHLLPWAFSYLDKVNLATLESSFYPRLAKIAEHFLKDMVHFLALTPRELPTYF